MEKCVHEKKKFHFICDICAERFLCVHSQRQIIVLQIHRKFFICKAVADDRERQGIFWQWFPANLQRNVGVAHIMHVIHNGLHLNFAGFLNWNIHADTLRICSTISAKFTQTKSMDRSWKYLNIHAFPWWVNSFSSGLEPSDPTEHNYMMKGRAAKNVTEVHTLSIALEAS